MAFDPTKEPMRAIRDLIVACESGLFMDDAPEDQATLERAQAAFTALRKLFGDARAAEEIADAKMIEPKIKSINELEAALQMTAGALRNVAARVHIGEQTEIKFNGRWSRFGTMTIASILDRANEALETT